MANPAVQVKEYKVPVTIDGKTFQVATTLYEKKGGLGIGAFANGFCIPNHSYRGLLEGIVDQANLELMISPAISGVPIKSNQGGKYPNRSHLSTIDLFGRVTESYSRIYNSTKATIVGDDDTADISHSMPLYANGHSSGGSDSQNARFVGIAHSGTSPESSTEDTQRPSRIVLINPILPVDYDWKSFAARGLKISGRHLKYFGLPGWKARLGHHGTKWNLNFVGNLPNNVQMMKSLSEQKLSDLYPGMKETDALMITSQATAGKYQGGDEFFDFDKWAPEMRGLFRSFVHVRIPEDTGDDIRGDFSHELVILHPEYFVPLVAEFLAEGNSGEKQA